MTVPSTREPGTIFSFAVGPCQGEASSLQCSLNVSLIVDSKVAATLPLDPVWSTSIERLDSAERSGIGDPLGSSEAAGVWRIGRGETAEIITVAPVRLSAQHEGVVVHRAYHGHYLLVVRRGNELFHHRIEGRWTDLAVRSRGETDQLTLFVRKRGEPGFVWAATPRWEAGKEALSWSSQSDPEAFLVAMGPYASQAEAEVGRGCLPGL